MKYAALIQNTTGEWQLTFPDIPGYARTAKVANRLLEGIERRLYEALHNRILDTGELPQASKVEGIQIHVSPTDTVRLSVLSALHKSKATTPKAAAEMLSARVKKMTDLFQAGERVPADDLFLYMEKLGVECEISVTQDDARAVSAAAPKKAIARKKHPAAVG